ncbi:acyl-CoA dehydrogenase family protein [Marinobacter sp. S6332]|uniref:acyl-CoA dehydrogenase family protein n=1 Tax=Marinobacter sp. S6332 TaxID=2926403 RepID=UPI001FF3D851|nr:acyl-CoA dehydrogenase family protein [Marinobacter sp. S6332]MCK0165589.1 acyl-CoA dehydrogenase family protein [Marinobacter sp. S6332]
MIPRTLFDADLEGFRDSVRKFLEQEAAPHHEQWEKDGHVSRELWQKAGELGFLCPTMPEEYGGAGVDFRYSAVVMEEVAKQGLSGIGWTLHSDIVAPYILNHGSEEQKKHYLPKLASGEMIGAIAMTEPGAGSDLQGLKTSALKDGDNYILNGSKTFITNGQMADLVVVVAKTDPKEGAKGTSLFLVESAWDGFEKGQNLNKVGMKAQDTSELFFQDVKIPATHLLGSREGQGFIQLMQELPAERLQIGLTAIAAAEAAWKWTLDYVQDRKAFGKPVIKFQNTRFKMAEMKADITAARVFTDRCLELHLEKKLDIPTAAMLKQYTTDLQCKVMDECVQLHGGYGYMWEYPIARAWADARVQRIYGGTNEIMKEIVARAF